MNLQRSTVAGYVPKRVLQARFRLERWRYRRLLEMATNPVIVYTMGKTGSTSIIRTIERDTSRRVFQIHRLGEETDRLERARLAEHPRHLAHHLWAAQHFRRHLPSTGRPWEVVSLTRDPMAQSVSAFFQTAERMGYLDPAHRSRPHLGDLVRSFVNDHDHERSISWFDDELHRFLGINVYDREFRRGEATSFEGHDSRVLLMRTEDLDEIASSALSSFLSTSIGPLARENVGSVKSYATAYRQFREQALLPIGLIDRVYSSEYATHFYSAAEIDRFRERWIRGAG